MNTNSHSYKTVNTHSLARSPAHTHTHTCDSTFQRRTETFYDL